MAELDPNVVEFLVESRENLDQLDQDLVAIEEDPGDRETLGRIFRTIHTIKGTCGFLALPRLEALSHAGENLLCRLRDGEMAWDPEITTALLALVDAVRGVLDAIEQTGSEGDRDHDGLIAAFEALQDRPAGAALGASAADVESGGGSEPGPEDEEEPEDEADDPGPDVEDASDPATAGPRAAGDGPADAAAPGGRGVSSGTIRVDVALLDKLMNLVGELVLARNQILQGGAGRKDLVTQGTSQRLNLITTELQEGVMKTRMQPIGNIWSKFPRVARDLALACGKQVRIDMEGKETELDKTILEAIKDPLTHVVRNAIDHGIEPPERRRAAGKPAVGRLRLRAYHESGHVNIEISDDGGGIDPDRIRAKAIERGLIGREQAARMGDRDLIQLLFLPGFSTADRVTNISGRGVGMDVVKTNIEKIGGTIDLQSWPGRGTSLKVKIPLTLAIIPALIVSSGEERYAIPQVNLLELVRLEGEEARLGIEAIHGAPIYRLRGQLLPLVFLGRELGDAPSAEGPPRPAHGRDGHGPEAINIVVLQADDRQFGLVVEGINDTEEIVVKPLGKQLKGLSLFAGATIMGDGRVALILDVPGIAQRAGVISGMRDAKLVDRAEEAGRGGDDRQTILLFGLGEGRRMAIPLSEVARLEEIPPSAVEQADGREVVQYRGQIMPLVRLADALGGGRPVDAAGDPMQVIVHSRAGRGVGLVVSRIFDIVETPLRLEKARGSGLLGSAIVQQQVIDVLDVAGLMRSVDPESFRTAEAVGA